MSDDDFERRVLAEAFRSSQYMTAFLTRAAPLGQSPDVLQRPPPSVRLAPECRDVSVYNAGDGERITVRCSCGTQSYGTPRFSVRCSGCGLALVVPEAGR